MGSKRALELAVAFLGVLLTGIIVALFHHESTVTQSAAERESPEGNLVSLGDHALAAPISTQVSLPMEGRRLTVGAPLPERPLEGQRRLPCNRFGEVEIRGGCWHRVPDVRPPCKEEGKADGYAWKGACYMPSYSPQRQPTADSP
jgi:hypothetical protein